MRRLCYACRTKISRHETSACLFFDLNRRLRRCNAPARPPSLNEGYGATRATNWRGNLPKPNKSRGRRGCYAGRGSPIARFVPPPQPPHHRPRAGEAVSGLRVLGRFGGRTARTYINSGKMMNVKPSKQANTTPPATGHWAAYTRLTAPRNPIEAIQEAAQSLP